MTYLALYDLLNSAKTSTPTFTSSLADASAPTSNVASLLQFTIPDGKLFYPEPFIASPSYLHSDITYLHIFQYWYWLWFMFIFLICFFFISFLCTIRWCTNRVRPRRETRGVSRSKCGDLITACVPVSWAISIIVNESTDATDLNDGFGTAELVVGVRAYQWGWEYYYPRSIDLNYNVRPSYSSFVGNSLKYNFSSGKSLATNNLWRMYQNKPEDRVITPAHLMLIPLDSGSMTNFLNFKNIGVNTLQESTAFSKIRNATKVYNSHLVHTPSTFTSKYYSLNNMFSDENDYLTTSSFGVKKQHNLNSSSSYGNSFASTTLDLTSFNKFLDVNLGLSTSAPIEAASPLSLQKENVLSTPADGLRISSMLSSTSVPVSSSAEKLMSYPTLLENINDDSDKEGLSYPITKLYHSNVINGEYRNSATAFSKGQLDSGSSITTDNSSLTNLNTSTTSKVYNLNGPNSKVLLGEQSIRSHADLKPSKSNYNLSSNVNTISSNSHFSNRLGRPENLFQGSLSAETDYADYALTGNLASSRSFISESHPAVQSSLPSGSNSLNYDATTAASTSTSYTLSGELEETTSSQKSSVGDVFVGSREKTPRAINTAYWSTFWATTNPNHRASLVLRANIDRTNFYLPTFSNYADYDFRNDQAIDMLEELFWETSYSGYNFYDYMTMSKDQNSAQSTSPKDFGLEKQFSSSTLGLDMIDKPLTAKILKDLSISGSYYGNSIQMEDYTLKPSQLASYNFALLPLHADLSELDESFSTFKGLNSLFSKFSVAPLGSSSLGLSPRSYISVFNHFRSDYEDFNWSRSTNSQQGTNALATSLMGLNPGLANSLALAEVSSLSMSDEGSRLGSDLRLSNPATLRSSVRNSIVNYNAFQKVFKPRLDEGRSHVNSGSFADLALKQPFLSDSKVPYLQLLGKNRDSFFSTPLYFNSTHRNFNAASSLTDSLNTPMYDFPFLLARTSDTMRFTWVDWFSKWKHVEVQPSSISRYSTLGAPYMRKPFDFNSTTGDKFQDTELYFTRVACSRRNFLTNWSYSPYMYNRAYVWNAESNFDSAFLNTYESLSSAKLACDSMSWYWLSPAFCSNTSNVLNFSSSGNDVYGKSTWRPTSSIASYYYNTSKLVDILSKREFIYRQYLENAHSVVHLPKSLCATPNNPILEELKSSFLFSDPSNFSSEYSRDLLYTATPYFKFVYLKSLSQQASNLASSLPINSSLLTNYALFYFFGTDTSEIGKNSELYKSQFRPLKKGISSMLRLHATGAIAMPIEIRLQVLASSRDVIHSWSIPSACVKIDCVPGYTSHRMMKFLLTGVYWGQCQEICGRYHHWMPIVVYFMKRDLFFLWCTHFVFNPEPNSTWDISDRRFADFIRFASYDKSSWLSEYGSSY